MRFFIAVILWCFLLVVSWPVALLVIVLFPLLWLIALPFRLVGVVVEGVFNLIKGIILLPFSILPKAK